MLQRTDVQAVLGTSRTAGHRAKAVPPHDHPLTRLSCFYPKHHHQNVSTVEFWEWGFTERRQGWSYPEEVLS